jgi:phage shock protein E
MDSKLYISPYLIMIAALSAFFIWNKEVETDKVNEELARMDGIVSHEMSKKAPGERFLLVDVRGAGEYAAGHCKGAINIPYESIAHDFPVMRLPLDSLVYVYCQTGKRAELAKEKLAGLGYGNIVNLNRVQASPEVDSDLGSERRSEVDSGQ